MTDLEQRLRDALRTGSSTRADDTSTTDAETLLSSVHRGVARRRRRRATVGAVTAATVLTVGGYAATMSLPGQSGTPVASDGKAPAHERPTPRPVRGASVAVLPSHTPASRGATATADTMREFQSPTTAKGTGSGEPGLGTPTGSVMNGPRRTDQTVTMRPIPREEWRPVTTVAASAGPDGRVYALTSADGSACHVSSFPAGTRCLQPYVSDDEGNSWRQLAKVPPRDAVWAPAGQGAYADQIAFTDDGRHGWMWGSTLLATHDGGATWTQVALPAGRTSLDVTPVGSELFVATGRAGGYRMPVTSDRLEAFSVDGQHLVDVTASDTAVFGRATDSSGRVQVFRGDDQGSSWAPVQPCVDGGEPAEVSASDTTVWALCPEPDGSGRWQVTRSTDDGVSFSPVTLTPLAPTGEAPQILAVDADHAFVDSVRSPQTSGRGVLVSSDGTLAAGAGFEPVSWESSTDGVAVATTAGQQQMTYDSASGWQRLSSPAG